MPTPYESSGTPTHIGIDHTRSPATGTTPCASRVACVRRVMTAPAETATTTTT